MLFVDKKAVSVIEAKHPEEAQRLIAHESQTGVYAAARLKWVNDKEPLLFLYESTGIITRLNDAHDPKLRSRDILFSPAQTLT